MRRLLLGIVAFAWGVVAIAAPAYADATPVQLLLTYMPNVSNTGASAASGIAELVMQEGEIRIEAAALAHLDGPERYAAWLVNSRTNQFYRLGSFNPKDGEESAHFEDVLPNAIPNKQWDLLLVTIETSADASRPSAKHSIAGTFPRSDRDPPPAVLPNTGGLDNDELSAISRQPSALQSNWQTSAVLAALTLVLGAGAGYALGKR